MNTTKTRVLAVVLVLLARAAAAQQPVQPLPQVGTPADTETNTQAQLPRIGAYTFMFNGTTWDRMRGDTTSGLWVNVKNASIAVTQSGTWTVQPGNTANTTAWFVNPFPTSPAAGTYIPVRLSDGSSFITQDTQLTHDGALTVGSTTGGALFGRASAAVPTDVSADNDAVLPWFLRSGATVIQQTYAGILALTGNGVTGTGSPRVTIASDNTPFAVKTDQTTHGTTDLVAADVTKIGGQTVNAGNGASSTGTQRVTLANDSTGVVAPVATALTGNGTTTYFLTSAASTNSTSVKGSAGNLYAIHLTNTTTTNYFLRLYDAASAPTCSSATNFIETIPALGAAANGGINGRVNHVPQAFATGIAFGLTGGGSSTDNTNAATGVYLTLEYK